jgi:hypothetical protein
MMGAGYANMPVSCSLQQVNTNAISSWKNLLLDPDERSGVLSQS